MRYLVVDTETKDMEFYDSWDDIIKMLDDSDLDWLVDISIYELKETVDASGDTWRFQ